MFGHCKHCQGVEEFTECPEEQSGIWHETPCPSPGMCDGKLEIQEK